MSDQYDVIIIGGGICGLTAATTAARLGMRTLIFTGQVLGGHLVSIEKIDGFPGHPEGIPGFDLCPATEEAAAEAGAEFAGEDITALKPEDGGFTITSETGEHSARAVIVATGTILRPLGVPGEEEFFGKGVSHCASCDAPMLKGKQVAVIGGGDSACQEALTLIPVCSKVTIVTDSEGLTAQAAYLTQIGEASNVEIKTGATVREIVGDSAVTGLKIATPAGEETLAVDSVFVFIGLDPISWLVPEKFHDEHGFILADASMRTAKKGLYAAGTIRAGAAFRAASAAGEGATAALSVFADLHPEA
ncbi:MAG: FAD-dependent oxidoreductase [Hyphomicrobiales bacterium]|nr:FAD-dependent oxidoreductase [Hyphomicrobiales bacterium]